MKPIAWYDPTNRMVSTDKDSPLFTPLGQVWPLYPEREPPRTWAGLADEEIEVLAKKHNGIFYDCDIEFARAIEAKLKDKNVQR